MFKLRYLVFGICAVLPALALHEYERGSLRSTSVKAHAALRGLPPAVKSLGPNDPYPVLPGGACSSAEPKAVLFPPVAIPEPLNTALSPTTSAVISAVPESRSISLFGVGLIVSIVLLYRMSRLPLPTHEPQQDREESELKTFCLGGLD
ncbi:MAG: hypothetical protein ACJ74Z_08380 [Bryobacteraceae bacterium]